VVDEDQLVPGETAVAALHALVLLVQTDWCRVLVARWLTLMRSAEDRAVSETAKITHGVD